jgi:hypothetical protein
MEILFSLPIFLLLKRHAGQLDRKTLIARSQTLAMGKRAASFVPSLQMRQRNAIVIIQIGGVARRLL